jgi:hypothetical protein
VRAFLGLKDVICTIWDTYLFGINVTSPSNPNTGQSACLGCLLLFAEAEGSVLVQVTTGGVRHRPVDLGRTPMCMQKKKDIMMSAKRNEFI